MVPRNHEKNKPQHVCDPLVCGIHYDQDCPLWDDDRRAVVERVEAVAKSKRLARQNHIAKRLGTDRDGLRESLAGLLRDDVAETVREVLAAELPEAMAVLTRRVRNVG